MTQALFTLAELPTPARPFLKWAGGKGQLLPELSRRLPRKFRRYHEPFVGGGALFFHLASAGRLGYGATLSDGNDELILCYEVVKHDVEHLITRLRWHERDLSADYFREVRNWDRQPDFMQHYGRLERAARTLFLNRTCYNGLYRLNRNRQFNAPFGHYKNPLICDPDNLRAVSRALQNVELRHGDFTTVAERASAGDLVYFDPPYDPVSTTSNFTTYTGQGFGEEQQRQLARLVRELADRGVHVMLSNSATPLTRELYASDARLFTDTVLASRKINCDGRKRGVVEELIVRSYPDGSLF